jgi:hypothetical protein
MTILTPLSYASISKRIGGPFMTVEAFVDANRKAFELHHPLA